MLQLDAYIRVSQVRGRGGDSFISPDVQEERIRAWAVASGHRISLAHRELDVSGATVDRPMLNEVMRRIEARETDGVVVFKLDRFGRTLIDSLGLIDRIQAAGGTFASVSDGFDLATETGRLVLRIMLSLAEFELDRIKGNWREARGRAVARGVHIASRTPTGYQRRNDKRLEPHPDHAPVIREVFERRAAGASWRVLSNLLDERGVVGPYESAQWTTRAVDHILRNRVYLGEARHGEFINRDAHEPIVTRELWESAQRAPDGPVKRGDDPALLAGLLRCAGCRHLLKPDKQTLRDGSRVRTYRCRGHHASGTCGSRVMVLGSVVEPFVISRFLSHVGDLAADPSRVGVTAEEVAEAEAELRAAEDELVAFRDSPAILAALGEAGFIAGLTARTRSVDDAQVTLAELRNAQAASGLPPVAQLRAMWPEMTTEEKQIMLRSEIDAVFLRSVARANIPAADRSLIFWQGQAPDDLPARGRRNLPLVPLVWPENPRGAREAVAQDHQEGALRAA